MITLTGVNKQLFKRVINLSRNMYKANYRELFGNRNRIEIKVEDRDYTKESTAYILINKKLSSQGITIIDYIKGYAQKDGDKNIYKIGKLIKDDTKLSNLFRDCSFRQKIKIILSRHPYDVACASYQQEWDSCLNIEDGECREYMDRALKANLLLVAYIVPDKEDTNGFEKPIGRVLVNPYFDDDNGGLWLQTASTGQGIYSDNFSKYLNQWLDKNYNNKFTLPKLKTGGTQIIFRFPDELVYDNDDPDEVYVINTNVVNDRKWVRDVINRGVLLQQLSKIGLRKVSDIKSCMTSNVLYDEVNNFIEYHRLYGRSDTKFKKILYAYFFLNEKEPEDEYEDEYFTFLSNNKLKFNGSVKIQEFLEREEYSSNVLVKYADMIDTPVKWSHAASWLDDLVYDEVIYKDSRSYKKIVKAFEIHK
jgi:hypothetical protein